MEHIKRLCEDLEISIPIQPSDKGVFTFPIGDDLAVEIREISPSGVYFYSPISPCPQVKKEEILTHIMKGNLFGRGTFGATIGMEEADELEMLTLSQEFSESMDYRSFKEALEDFANIVEYWRVEVDQHIQKAKSELL